MSELNELIRKRDDLTAQIEAMRKRQTEEREQAWSDIDRELVNRIRGRWRKEDLIFELTDATVTMHDRLGECWMTVLWTGGNKGTFGDPPPVDAFMAFIDALDQS